MPAAAGRTDQGYLNRLPSDRLPKEVVGDIFTKAQDQSIMLQLARRIPVSINETVITTPDFYPEAGQVGGTTLASREGAEKPIQGINFGTSKSFSPIKLAVIVTVSEEFARENVDALYSQLSGALSGAIARAADLAVFHNRDAITGAALVGTTNNGYINATTNRVELNWLEDDPDVIDQIISGVELVEAEADSGTPKNFECTAFAADKVVRTKSARLRDASGQPIFGTVPGTGAGINIRDPRPSLLGLPVFYGRSVKGRLGAYAGASVEMFTGDWSQVAYGFADQIRVKVSDEATVGGVSMWQTNQIAVLAEATFGWIVNDVEAFAAYDNAVTDA